MGPLLIIRHGEKPGTGAEDGPGLRPDGTPDQRGLTVRGWQRAGAWATLFGSELATDYPVPTAIYAASPDRGPGPKPPSRRPHDTVVPLASRLGLRVDARWAQGEEEALAAELRAVPGVAVVCWEHKRIPGDLLPALLRGTPLPAAPTMWDPARFDVVLRLDRGSDGRPTGVRQLFPRLLSGDSDVPML